MHLLKKDYELLFFVTVTALSIFRFSYYGFSYTPYLDDYIQYSLYPSIPDALHSILFGGAGVLFTRPLAGLFDFFLWSRLWEHLGLAVFIISFLWGLSGILFFKAFKNCKIYLGPMFFAFYLFLPLNIEGTYWLSASSRIVVSLFFASLGIYFLTTKRTFLFFIFNCLSFWFYEQCTILSFFLGLFFCVKQKEKKLAVFPLFSLCSLLLFYLIFAKHGDNSDRLSAFNPLTVPQNIINILTQLASTFGIVSPKIIFLGFARGFYKVSLDFSLFWLAFLIVFVFFFYNLAGKIYSKTSIDKKVLFFGLFLFFLPCLPFLVLENSFFNLRNAVPCLLGLAILLDNLLTSLFRGFTPLLAAVLIFVFSLSAVSEIFDYQYTANQDFSLASKIAKQVTPETTSLSVKVTSPPYFPQNAPWGDHIKSMTASDWGPTGIVRTISKNKGVIVNIGR